MKINFIFIFLVAFVVWKFEFIDLITGKRVRDTLERSIDGINWLEIPGPYRVTNGEYWVRIKTTDPIEIYRIRREWGNVWTN